MCRTDGQMDQRMEAAKFLAQIASLVQALTTLK